ncbi:MAG: GHKL domain-containing protein [Deltaproteobacteria bacterium]|nr:GHKL domain-containing protein [Deltaproteobacteria bacterium]
MAGTFEDVPSAKIIRNVLDVLGPQLKKRGIKVDVQGRLPVIHCDRNRIYQVFENLIQNSIKYMGDTESPVIEIGCKKRDGFHEFYVKDNGIGIDPKYHQKIFQIFQRLKEVDTKGTGVGLATVERIAEVHGGSVRVESERGKGATFYFTVPLVRG